MINEYTEYIQSSAWRIRAAQAKAAAEYKCQRCGAIDVPLEVHHLTYDRLGEEEDADLKVVCQPCHKIEDNLRAARTGKERKKAAFETYASKRWGDDWFYVVDEEEAHEEFEDWFERVQGRMR